MQFGIINLYNFILIAVILVPNMIYAMSGTGTKNRCTNRGMNLLEQIGRYACMLLMVFPVGVWKFGFSSAAYMVIDLAGTILLLLSYLLAWRFYFRKKTDAIALALALLPTAIFLLSALTLRHWLLAVASLLFGTAHVYVTWQNRP